MAEADRLARAAPGSEVHERARHRGCGRDRDRCRAHHRVVQLAHRDRACEQVDVVRAHRLAARREIVLRRRDERDLRRERAPGSRGRVGHQPHAHRARDAQRFELRERRRILVDRGLQFGAIEAERGGVDEYHRHACVDQRRLEAADARQIEFVDELAAREHRAAVLALVGGIEELERDLGGGECHAVEFEVTGFLHLTPADGHVREDRLADIGLPDAHRAVAVARHAR